MRAFVAICVLACASFLGHPPATVGAEEPASQPPAGEPTQTAPEAAPEPNSKPFEPPRGEHIKQLGKEEVWIDTQRKAVIVNGKVCLRDGRLEMFACPRGTKEHESIVAVSTKSYVVHAGLLAVGAVEGSPVQYDPEYKPARGPEVKVQVLWVDEKGEKHQAPAQNWIRDLRTGKEMAHQWVFAGSRFWVDEQTGEKHYLAEGGDLICVSNFNTAALDLPVESSQMNDRLSFEAFTERIPPVGTHVRLVLTPHVPAKGADDKPAGKAPAEPPASEDPASR